MNLRHPFIFVVLICMLLMACTKARKYTYEIIGATYSNADKSGVPPVSLTSDSVRSLSYAIKCTCSALLTGHDDGFDDVYEDVFSTQSRIEAMNIYSLTDFDSTHPAYSSLNDRFNVLFTSPEYKVYPLSGNNFIWPDFNFHQKRNDADSFKETRYFTLLYQPELLGSRTFIIELTKTDSTKYIDTLNIKLY